MTPTDGCSWYPHRFNVVAFGVIGVHMQSEFTDALNDALSIRNRMLNDGAEEVKVYDTVDGLFY